MMEKPWKAHANNALGYPLLACSILVLLFVVFYHDVMQGKLTFKERHAQLRQWFLSLFLTLVKEIKSKEGVLHFRRWSLIETSLFNVYVHRIYKHDEDEHLHNHPWNFVVLCLAGRYVERIGGKLHPMDSGLRYVKPFSLRRRLRTAFHKIHSLETKHVTTLVFTWGERQEWGYDVDGRFVDNRTYREDKREDAEFKRQMDRLDKLREKYEEENKMLKELGAKLKLKNVTGPEVLKAIKELNERTAILRKQIEEIKKQ